jgi:hypothetical protein
MALQYGNIDVLEWIKKSGYEFTYSKSAINNALIKGYIHVLDWLKQSCYELQYDKNIILYLFQYNRINILKWFKDNNYKLKCNVKQIIKKKLNKYKIQISCKTTNIICNNFIKWNRYNPQKIKSYYLKQYKYLI